MIEETLEYKAQTRLLAEAGRWLAQRGWIPATAGNFSARLNAQQIVITASGRHKGQLDASGFLVVDLEGHVLSPGKTPSADTFLHIIMYRRNPDLGAMLHTHSVHATVLSRRLTQGLVLEDYEVLRTFFRRADPSAALHLPVFPHAGDVQQLAAQVDAVLGQYPDLAGYLIQGHGLYTWGRSVEEAMRYAEAFEFMFECEIMARTLESGDF